MSFFSKDKLNNTFLSLVLAAFIVTAVMQSGIMVNNPVVVRVGSKALKVTDIRKYMSLVEVPDGYDRNSEEVINALFEYAIDIAVHRALLNSECENLGIVVTNEDIRESIRNNPMFFIDGMFSRRKFLSHIKKIGVSELEYYQIERENLMHLQFFHFIKNSYAIPEDVSKKFNKAYYARRNVKYAIIDHSKIKIKNYSKKDLIVYFNKHIDKFKMPEKRVYKAIEFVNISEDELKVIQTMLRHGSFENIIKNYDVKVYEAEEVVKNFDKMLISSLDRQKLQLKQCTGLLKHMNKFSQKGQYCAFQVFEIVEAYIPKFEEVEKLVKFEYEKEMKKQYVDALERKMKANRASMFSFVDYKKRENLTFNDVIEDLPDNVFEAIFYSKIGTLERFDIDGKTYLLCVESIKDVVFDNDNYLKNILDSELMKAIFGSLRYKYKVNYCL